MIKTLKMMGFFSFLFEEKSSTLSVILAGKKLRGKLEYPRAWG